MRCPYRFGDVQETCYKEECHAYGRTVLLADTDEKNWYGWKKQKWKSFPYCHALKKRIIV